MRLSKADRETLKNLPYPSYLRTKFWKSVREMAIARAGSACQLCNNKTRLQVHHRTYENRGYEDKHLGDLTVLCRTCHQKFHQPLKTAIKKPKVKRRVQARKPQ
ncbi:HNH endonuclease [Nostoc sp.]|uniref:HNH endonuclease n=1 Tax=Nostoc sp. TaxID=1180 RepID=UPI002FFB27A2